MRLHFFSLHQMPPFFLLSFVILTRSRCRKNYLLKRKYRLICFLDNIAFFLFFCLHLVFFFWHLVFCHSSLTGELTQSGYFGKCHIRQQTLMMLLMWCYNISTIFSRKFNEIQARKRFSFNRMVIKITKWSILVNAPGKLPY